MRNAELEEAQAGIKIAGENINNLKYANDTTLRASLMAQMVKCVPAMRETWVQSLGWEDLLEKEMATHSSILTRRIPWTEEPGRLQSTGHKESDTTERLHSLTHFLHYRQILYHVSYKQASHIHYNST